jgi:hypothetical protein
MALLRLIACTKIESEPQILQLSGAGGAPPFLATERVSPNFGRQRVGTVSEPQSVTLTNLGAFPIVIQNLSVTGSACSQGDETCESVAAGQSCVLTITFTPDASETFTGDLVIQWTSSVYRGAVYSHELLRGVG